MIDQGRLHAGRRHQAHRMTKSLQFARPMMRRGAGFDTNEARRQLLKEWQNVPALKPAANDYITCSVNSVDLKNRLGDVETACMFGSSESWGPQQHPHPWHFRAGGGAVHSIKSTFMHRNKSPAWVEG